MVSDLFFENVTEQVCRTCSSLNYSCTFYRFSECIKVYPRLNHYGRPIITGNLIDSVCSVTGVSLVSVSIDDYGKLYALFTINEPTDGNSD